MSYRTSAGSDEGVGRHPAGRLNEIAYPSIRVLMFGRYADQNPGGVQEHVASLRRALRDDAQIVNLVPRRGDVTSHEIAADGEIWRSASIGEFASVTLSPAMPLRAVALHRTHRYQIAHLHFPDPMSHLASLALPGTVRRVITWHSDIVRQRGLLKLYRPFLLRAVRSAGAVLAATPAHFESSTTLREIEDKSRFRVVPFGFDYSRFDTVPERVGKIRASVGGKAVIFALGRHVYYKGFEYLIEAMARVEEAVLFLGGTGPLTPELRARAERLRLGERVRFLGHVPDEELPGWYHACDVFCMPSVEPSEAFGIVQVEAMACGKPVVCCRLGNGVNYVNSDGVTGIAVPPRDVPALAAAIRRLCADPALRASLGAAGRKRVRTEYTVERMREGMLEVYRDVLR